MAFVEVRLKKCVVYLTPEEIHSLLLKEIDLYKLALSRGKAFERSQDKKSQYSQKWSNHEAQNLNHFMQ